MYTVMIADDGMFSAEYVVPPALSIPLGASGSAVDVVRNEDGTFSADGEVITAETRVTAANGNVYAAVLSPEGVPVSAMHVAAMQDVMLGELGGTVKLTQAEDMSWWLGETAVADGSVHTHENGNMYTLMMDAEGMWSAMYKKVEVIVQLGTQDPITLERDEDMSWRLGSEAVDVGSEVMSDNGNTYSLWYADGVWTASFVPESMMIEGTGLVAMTREGDDMYDVEDVTLPASGLGDITTSMGTYRVTMTDGMLMGTRLDPVGILGGVYRTPGLRANPSILPDEDNTEDVNEGMTALRIVNEDHPFSALLGSGMSETQGSNFVSKARDELIEIRAKLAAVLDVFETDHDRDKQVRLLWGTNIDSNADEDRNQTVKKSLQAAFGTISGLADTTDARVAPDHDDALSEIDELIMALSSVDSLAAALADEGALKELGVEDDDITATAIFDATKSETSVSYGVLGGTRYGAISKQDRADAVSKADHKYDTQADDDPTTVQRGAGELGAFAFGVIEETVRTRHVASSGNAYYEGGTLAVDEGGMHYSGDISVRVRFATDKVDGLITNLVSADGEPWVHVFDEVSSIVLPQRDLRSNATWVGGGSATISYALRAGSAGWQVLPSTFQGRLLGRGSDAGSEAHGTWSVGATPDADSYLAGGFGAIRVADEPDRRPTVDDGTGVGTKLLRTDGGTYANSGTGQGGTGMTVLEDGKLTVTVGKFGWTQRSPAAEGNAADLNQGHTWKRLDDSDTDAEDDATIEYEINLADLVAKAAGGEANLNGDIHRAVAKEMIETERKKLAVLIETDQLGGEGEAQPLIWERVQEILLTRVFNAHNAATSFAGRLPDKVNHEYEKDTALETIDQIIWALSSDSNLESALDKDESGLFVQQDDSAFLKRGAGDIFTEKELQVRGRFGMTDFTRFGVWRVRRTRNALRSNPGDNTADAMTGDKATSDRQWIHGELDTFAYSPLDQSKISSLSAPNFPNGGNATYEGSTVAFVGNDTKPWGLVGFEGDVEVHVTWDGSDPDDGTGTLALGTMTAVISNFAKADTGDPLMHSNTEVSELIFSASAGRGIPITTNEKHEVMFNPATLAVSVRYANRSSELGTVSGTSALNGMFVGSSSDGPLGVLGRYSIPTGAELSFMDGVNNRIDVSIDGAFGADLP